MSYQYTYLFGSLILLVLWGILFLLKKDSRKEMWITSLALGFGGLLVEFVYAKDWWHPLTITNTLVGIEDFIFGFTCAGIASVIYEVVFGKRLRIKKVSRKKEFKEELNLVILGSLLAALFFSSFYLLHLHSFYASVIAFIVPTLIIWIKRRDLIINSILSGLLLSLLSFLFFLPEYITPGWVKMTWYLENLTGIIILKTPLEDLIWFFLAGLFLGPLYEYWKEGKLVNRRRK